MIKTIQIINDAFNDYMPVVAFSGGKDSLVLLDIIYRFTHHKPTAIYVHNDLLRAETLSYVKQVCIQLNAPLKIVYPKKTAYEQWRISGYPILGNLASVKWMQKYSHLGVKINCNSCCRALKIAPGRRATRELGMNAQLTGIRSTDDQNRWYKLTGEGHVNYNKADKLYLISPLAHWTDLMVRRYIRMYELSEHPGDGQTGCSFCAGGWKFTGNSIYALRRTDPEAWRKHLLESGIWKPMLVVKLKIPLNAVEKAVAQIGGIEKLLDTTPQIFDYGQDVPIQGYQK